MTCWLAPWMRSRVLALPGGPWCPGWPRGVPCCSPGRRGLRAVAARHVSMRPRRAGLSGGRGRGSGPVAAPAPVGAGPARALAAGRWTWPGRRPERRNWSPAVPGAFRWRPGRPPRPARPRRPAAGGCPGKWPGWPMISRAGSRWPWTARGWRDQRTLSRGVAGAPWYRRNCHGCRGWILLSRTTCGRGRGGRWATSATCSRRGRAGGGSRWARRAGAALPWRWPRWPACAADPRR